MDDLEFLKHYGVLGMKWGVRRSHRKTSSDHDTIAALKKKRASELSDAELKMLTNRLQLEKQYRQLNPTTADKGKKIVGEVIGGPAKIVAKELVTSYIKRDGAKILDAAIASAKKGAKK